MKERFGPVYIDYTARRRIPGDPARGYRGVIRGNGGSLGGRGRSAGRPGK